MLTKPARPLLHPETLIATWFGSGLLPYVPGTWGSLAALPFAWFIISAGGWALLLCAIAVLFCVGVWGAARYEEVSARKDPGEVVVDEVAGQWLAMLPVAIWIPEMPGMLIASLPAFILFRLFDIWKPWPVSLCERRFRGGLGIMIDDIAAGIYAVLTVLVGVVFMSFLLH